MGSPPLISKGVYSPYVQTRDEMLDRWPPPSTYINFLSSPSVLAGSVLVVDTSAMEGSVKFEGNPLSHYLHPGSSEGNDEVTTHL